MKKKKNKVKIISWTIAIIFILVGSAIFLYPEISNYFAEKGYEKVIRNYEANVTELEEEDLSEEWEKAKEYNNNLSGTSIKDPFIPNSGYTLPENYTEVLNIGGDGLMAYIEIPKISCYLPIYHGTSADILAEGVGHIESTSLPIGGESTHCVLIGHTGLSTAELFTRINELEEGDIFYIYVLDTVLAYKVYETKVILPDEINELQIVEGKDLVTLVTCTPYGVNTHRLLVKAERTTYMVDEEDVVLEQNIIAENTEEEINYLKYYAIGTLIVVAICIIIILIIQVGKIVEEKKK